MVRVATRPKKLTPRAAAPHRSEAFQLKLLTDVTNEISSEINVQKALYAIVQQIFDYFHPRGASIMIVDGEEVRVVAGRSVSQSPQSRPQDLPTFKLGEGVAGRVALSGQPEWIEDTAKDPRFHRLPGKQSKIRAILAVPMKVRGRVMGVLSVSYSEPRTISEEEVSLLQIIAIPAAYAIQNASLFEKVVTERERMELIQKSIKDGVTLSDLRGNLLYINPAAEKMFGDTPPLQLSLKKPSARKDIQINFSLQEVLRAVERDGVFQSIVVLGGKTTRYIQSHYMPYRQAGEVIGVIGTHRDETELFSQAQEIRDQLVQAESERERFQAIFDNVEEGIVVTDREGIIVEANPATEIISGVNHKELIGQAFSDIFPLENGRGVKLVGNFSPGLTVLTTGESIEYLEARFTNAEGREIWVGLSVTPSQVKDSVSANDQVIFVMRDISRLKEIDQAKSDFVSMASHELRTPLTVINGYIDLFMSGDLGAIDRPELAHYTKVFSQIQKSTQRLNTLVEDLLNVSRIEQGRLNLNLERINLTLLVQDVASEMKAAADKKNIALEFDQPAVSFLELPILVRADHDKVRQVLVNLIDNAIKYTKDGGKVKVSLKRDRREAIVNVSDTGIGIPKQQQTRIFDKFQRIEGSYVKNAVGTGLGLYIVRELLRVHNGRVWVESSLGKGSTFSFSLPLNRELG